MNNKLNNAESTGATVLVADNPGCLMHLRGGVDVSRRRIRVLHLAQLIAEQNDVPSAADLRAHCGMMALLLHAAVVLSVVLSFQHNVIYL
jgi:hypothetical protein